MEAPTSEWFTEIAVRVAAADVDPVANYIIEHISGGLLLEDEDNDSRTAIKFYVADGIDLSGRLDGLRRFLASVNSAYVSVPIDQRRIQNLDWIEAYKKSVVPVYVGDGIVVKPPWNREEFPGRIEIIIEPKMAFGTGRHESTRGSLAELEKLDLTGRRVLDLGCGSGILGIYAAKRGVKEVIGYDVDPLAVDNSRENFAVNGVDSVCRAAVGAIDEIPMDERFDIIVVNIIKAVIIPILGALNEHLAPGGTLILAGLLIQDRQDVAEALRHNELNSFSVQCDGEWLTFKVKRS